MRLSWKIKENRNDNNPRHPQSIKYDNGKAGSIALFVPQLSPRSTIGEAARLMMQTTQSVLRKLQIYFFITV
jgi:hypothetical protein